MLDNGISFYSPVLVNLEKTRASMDGHWLDAFNYRLLLKWGDFFSRFINIFREASKSLRVAESRKTFKLKKLFDQFSSLPELFSLKWGKNSDNNNGAWARALNLIRRFSSIVRLHLISTRQKRLKFKCNLEIFLFLCNSLWLDSLFSDRNGETFQLKSGRE